MGLDNEVCVRAAKAERAYRCKPRRFPVQRPFLQTGVHIKRAIGEIDMLILFPEVDGRRHLHMLEAKQYFY
ncbi:hypothetical protein D3C75_1178020 [compost metagenome]